ncbi:MAG TPA: sialidase family protein [Bacteroidales bacterium]|nr:sialidase family protein [Bacteroidales bacterium]
MKYLHRHFLPIAILFLASGVFAQGGMQSLKITVVANELIFNNPPFKQCHASTLVELADGRIMAAWFAGPYERHPDVSIWTSIKSPAGWSPPVMQADGVINDTLRYPCWNPVLFRTKQGELFLFYKVGPSPSEWWGMYKKSHDDGQTWSEPVRLPNRILGPIRAKPVYLSDGRIVSPSSTEDGAVWNVHMELSDNHGQSWSRVSLDTTTGFRIIQPTLLTLADGSLLAFMRSDQNVIVESRSVDGGNTWSRPVLTDIVNPNAGVDALTLKCGLHLLVYNKGVSGREWYEGRSKLFLKASFDGEHWYDVLALEDKTTGEYSYPAIIQSSDGLVHISYTSDRVNIRYMALRIEKELKKRDQQHIK